MNYFDLHCDLIYRMVTESQGICNNDFNIENNSLFLLSENICEESCPKEIFTQKVSNIMDILLQK